MFLDEPSAGLDPVTSGKLDELILKIKEAFGTTSILVTNEVPSIRRLADFGVYTDPHTGRPRAYASPNGLPAPGWPRPTPPPSSPSPPPQHRAKKFLNI